MDVRHKVISPTVDTESREWKIKVVTGGGSWGLQSDKRGSEWVDDEEWSKGFRDNKVEEKPVGPGTWIRKRVVETEWNHIRNQKQTNIRY